LNVNILYFLVGFFFIGVALYLWIANWGNLDPGFFIGSGIICCLLGIAIATVSCLAGQGIKFQTFKRGFWTGRKIVGVYIFFLGVMFAALIVLLQTSLLAVEQFKEVYEQLIDPDNTEVPAYVNFEETIQEKFNNFFFGASSSCSASLYIWFWNWVDNNCPANMSQTLCQACFPYSVTMCVADESMLRYQHRQRCGVSLHTLQRGHHALLLVENQTVFDWHFGSGRVPGGAHLLEHHDLLLPPQGRFHTNGGEGRHRQLRAVSDK